MATDFVSESGSPKRHLGPDEEEALARLRADGQFCLASSHGTRAPTFCGLRAGHRPHRPEMGCDGHLYFSVFYLAANPEPWGE